MADSKLSECGKAVENCVISEGRLVENGESETTSAKQCASPTSNVTNEPEVAQKCPKLGMTSVRGRRRDMEDAVAIHPLLCRRSSQNPADLHFFGVYDGHGCSHVAMKCKDRLHEIVRDELESHEEDSWKKMMERSFSSCRVTAVESGRYV